MDGNACLRAEMVVVALDTTAVFRICGWPVETLDALAAPGLASEFALVAAEERDLQTRSKFLSRDLHAIVPRLSHKQSRRWILAVKRALHRTESYWDDPSDTVRNTMAAAFPDLMSRITAEARLRRELTERKAACEVSWSDAIAFGRRELERLADAPRFLRGLTVASPRLAEQWRRRGRHADAGLSRQRRRLDGVILRYLLRAVGRPTPHAAWATVTFVRPVDSDCPIVLREVASRTVVVPDLRPFRDAVAQLSTTDRYTKDYPLRIDPATHSDGSYWYGVDAAGGWRRVPCNALFDAVIDALGGTEPRPAAPLVEALSAVSGTPGKTRELLNRAIDLLIRSGVLRSALEFPAAPGCPWRALDDVASQLWPGDTAVWSEAVTQCRNVADALAQDFDHLDPGNIRDRISESRAAVLQMLKVLKVDAVVPDNPLRIDRTSPFDVGWSSAGRNALQKAVTAVLDIHARAGAADTMRRALFGPRAGTRVPLGEAVRRANVHDAEAFAEAIAAWRAWWMQSRPLGPSDVTIAIPPMMPTARDVPGFRGTMSFWIIDNRPPVYHWSRPQPDIAWSRFHTSLAPPEIEPRWPFGLAEVVGIDPENPNAAIRAIDGRHQLGRHREAMAALPELVLDVDADGRAWLELANGSGRLMPIYSSAARIGSRDPVGRFLFQLAMTHGWEFLAYQLQPQDWLSSQESPRISLENTVVLSPRRWRISSSDVRGLRRLAGAARYRSWRDLIVTMGIGRLAWVARAAPPDDPAFLIRTDSPLIADCILSYVKDVDVIVTEAPDADTWPLRDCEGNHYVGELAVGWTNADYPCNTTAGT